MVLRLYSPLLEEREISLRLKPGSPFWNGRLLRCLPFAIFLHLGAMLLLQIAQPEQDNKLLYSEATIEIDLGDLLRASAQPVELPKFLSHLKDIEQTLTTGDPTIKPLNLSSESRKQTMVARRPKISPDQTIYQKSVTPFHATPLSFNYKFAETPVEVRVSGGLSQLELTNEGTGEINDLLAGNAGKHVVRYVFKVIVDSKEGAIFWTNQTQPDVNPTLKVLSKHIIHSMRFEPNAATLEKRGTVELLFRISDEAQWDEVVMEFDKSRQQPQR